MLGPMFLERNYSVYFTVQFIFATIHKSHYTFWYYSWVSLYYFSYLLVLSTVLLIKKFQFQLNKLFSNGPVIIDNKVLEPF